MQNETQYNPAELFYPDTKPAFGPEALRQRLQALVDMQVEQLGLGSWRVRAEFTRPNDQFRAQLKLNRYFNQAIVYVCDDEEEAIWDLLVAHELLHLIHDPWSIFFHELLGRIDSEREREIFRARIEAIEEPLMNALAEALTGNIWPTTPDQEVIHD